MSKRWQDRWARVKGVPQGGQSLSFIARPVDGDGPPCVFIKTLHDDRMQKPQPRGRFMREVAIYRSLKGLGLPELYDDNTETWEDTNTPLYMATEFIDGPNLRTYIGGRRQTADINSALECVRELAEVLNRCHANGVTHRDIKPANIICARGDITKPRLVDFGISFNDAADDDLTRMNEDVGNRFLHLPEHARGGRFPASDVTQLAGIFLYTVTGHEPRELRDESGQMPHQRPEARGVLAQLLDQRQLLRVMSVLDKAFAHQIVMRYATAPDLASELERAMQSDEAGDGDLQGLRARLAEIIDSQGIASRNQRRDDLFQLMHQIHNTVRDFASANGGLSLAQSTNKVRVTSSDELDWNERQLAVSDPLDDRPRVWMVFRVERWGGAGDYVVLVDGVEIWRGETANDSLTEAVQIAAANHILAILGEPGQDGTEPPA